MTNAAALDIVQFDLEKVPGLDFSSITSRTAAIGKDDNAEQVLIYQTALPQNDNEAKPFLVLRKNTLEFRTDPKLQKLLRDKYESVMESRYFGRGGLEVVNSGQLTEADLIDLVRLSYDLTRK